MFVEEKITKEMIMNGLEKGIIQIINNENDGCISAKIRDYWFYFTGSEDEEMTAEKYCKSYTKKEITDMIYNTINEEPINGCDEDDASEWLYYRECLKIEQPVLSVIG